MADSVTTNLSLTKPEDQASDASWGPKTNTNLDLIDDLIDGVTPSTQAIGDSAVIGSTLKAARVDHKHAMPASIVAGDLASDAVTTAKILANNVTLAKLSSDITTWMSYRRSRLNFRSVTDVDIEGNTLTLNETKVVFPDGEARTVLEDTASTHKFRRFIITATAEFTSGTEDSGLRSGLSEADNTWYAIYVVKSTIDATKFVLAGDTTLPTQANAATLNTRYGTNGWLFIGTIRNGDSGATAGDILNFAQFGAWTFFQNVATSLNYGGTGRGVQLATSASATTLTYSFAAGTGDTNIPNGVGAVVYAVGRDSPATDRDFTILNSAGTYTFYRSVTGDRALVEVQTPPSAGIKEQSDTTAVGMDILLVGYSESHLGLGANPIL